MTYNQDTGYNPNTGYGPNPGYQQNYGAYGHQQYNAGQYGQPYPGVMPPAYGQAPPQYNPYNPPHPGAIAGYSDTNYVNATNGMAHGDIEAGILPHDSKILSDDLPIEIRHGFIRKVYALVFLQLIVTFGIAFVFIYVPKVSDFVYNHYWIVVVALVVMVATMCAFACVPTIQRTYPWNILCMSIFSAAFGVLLGIIGAASNSYAFVAAVGITLAVVLALTAFAIQTKWDFTGMGGYLIVGLVVLLVVGLLCAFIKSNKLHMVYSGFGALVFSFYLVYDTQQIVGGKHRKNTYSVDDYAFAAFSLYTDIMNLFLYILDILQRSGAFSDS